MKFFTVALSALLLDNTCATFSIVAANRKTDQVGGAGGSCKGASVTYLDRVAADPNDPIKYCGGGAPGPDPVYCIYGSVAGKGSFVVQGVDNDSKWWYQDARNFLDEGNSPAAFKNAVINGPIDNNPGIRQYGVVASPGFFQAFDDAWDAQTFNGGSNDDIEASKTGEFRRYSFAIQGNRLTGEAVLDSLDDGFRNYNCWRTRKRCMLAGRLMDALEAVFADPSQGDSDCTDPPDPLSADSVFIHIDGPFDDLDWALNDPAKSFLHLEANKGPGIDNPFDQLRKDFEIWWQDHNCDVLFFSFACLFGW
jgi:hypothetical protein